MIAMVMRMWFVLLSTAFLECQSMHALTVYSSLTYTKTQPIISHSQTATSPYLIIHTHPQSHQLSNLLSPPISPRPPTPASDTRSSPLPSLPISAP